MKPLLVGTPLYGFCGGYLHRDSYGDKRVEAVGIDWVVVRCENGKLDFADGENIHEQLAEYTVKPKEE